MKRKLALFLVLAMIISLIPANVFAATDNYVDKVPTVKKDQTAEVTVTMEAKTGTTFGTESFKLALENADFDSITASGNVQLTNTVSDSEEIFALNGDSTTTAFITFVFEATEVGDIKLAVDGMGGTVSNGTLTVGKCVDGGTLAKVAGTVTIGEAAKALKTITIEETAANSLATDDVIKLRLPKDFTWTSATTSGNYGGVSVDSTTGVGTRDLEITVDGTGNSIGGIYVTGTILAGSDAKYGDVNVTLSGDNVTSQTLKVGTYSDYGVVVELDDEDIPTIYSGRDGEDDDDFELQTIVVSEDIAGSLLENRKIRIEFPEEITIANIDMTSDEFIGTAPTTTGKEYIEFTYAGTGAAEEMQFTFNVTAESDFEGDIVAEVSGSSIGKTTKLVVGKAVLTGKVEAKAVDVKLGLQNQPMGEITITEPEAGLWTEEGFVTIELPDGFTVDNTPDVEVVKGDIEVDEDVVKSVTGGVTTLKVKVDNESDVASTIVLKNGTVKLDRNLAEGDYEVTLAGDALNDGGDVMDVVAFRVITPAPGDTTAGEKVVFTIGSADYMIGATKMTSDVAPYINEQGRTMLPLRALANALGVTDSNIMWNEVERSVTIFKGDATIKVVIGQMSFVKNGVAVPMDTMAVIMNGRTMLPLRAIGQALGAVITWDEATRTVTVN